MFSPKERLFLELEGMTVHGFRFDSDVCALKITNSRGEMTILPYQGQQIWSLKLDGRELAMCSMFDQPRNTQVYLDTYGGFLLHCGATAMGVPGPKDNHPLHGELPNAPYQSASILVCQDDLGPFIGITGEYRHTVAFNYNYVAVPIVKMRPTSAVVTADITIKNLKNTSMPFMYLAHANFRPVNGGELVYSALSDPQHVKVRASIPPHIHPQPGYKEFLAELSQDPTRHHILRNGLAFDPEVVFFIDYLSDEHGWAHTLQIHPSGVADYIAHRPSELRKGVRWISRTPDQDALGLILPATAEPEGYHAELEKGNVLQLGAHEQYDIHMQMGALRPEETVVMKEKINAMIQKGK
jgi:hypothetical protein